VAQNVLNNRARVAAGRKRLLQDHAAQGGDDVLKVHADAEISAEDEDIFYAAWAEELLRQSVKGLLKRLHREGKGDYFRVLYGRICEEMTTSQIAQSLGATTTTVENYFKAARKQLAAEVESLVRQHVRRLSRELFNEQEFAAEWQRLAEHLTSRGGLEQAVRDAQKEGQA
jgi:DNA-directed RNA polymerase specialized sigma24 family protein